MEEDSLIDASQIGKDVLLEFLEVAINNLLYIRQLYAPGAFKLCKKYDVPVQMCIHPEVTSYIRDMLSSLVPAIDQNEVEYIAFVVTQPGKTDAPLERFVFDIAIPKKGSLGDDRFLVEMEQALRSFLLKLNICDSVLKPLPSDASWTIQVKTSDACVLNMQNQERIQDFKWLVPDVHETVVQNAQIVPLRAMDASVLKVRTRSSRCV